MLTKFFARPLELTIGDQTCKFSSTADFGFSMAGRTAVPTNKLIAMVDFSMHHLKEEAKTIKDIEKRFVSILSQSIEEPDNINLAMSALDPLIFSQDHGWRDIITALNNSGANYAPLRRIALVKYMQYLSSRQEVIKCIYAEKKKLLKDGAPEESPDAPSFKETLILDAAVLGPTSEHDANDSDDEETAFEKMPKGEAITVNLPSDSEVEVLLSKHKCKIIAGNKLKFVDPENRSFTLNKERNLIGRDSTSTVILDPSLRDVSRLHLVIERFDDHALQLTDMSAHGTFIKAKWLQDHSSW